MDEIIAEIKRLIAADAVHRKGFRLQHANPKMAADHAHKEISELVGAVELYYHAKIYGGSIDCAESDVLSEIADVIGCLMHLAVMLDFDEEQIKSAVFRKFKLRIKEPAA